MELNTGIYAQNITLNEITAKELGLDDERYARGTLIFVRLLNLATTKDYIDKETNENIPEGPHCDNKTRLSFVSLFLFQSATLLVLRQKFLCRSCCSGLRIIQKKEN